VLHVSPFCRVEGHYVFRVRETAHGTSIAIDYYDSAADDSPALIRTAIALRKLPLTRANALAALLRQPWLTISVIARIHWQAVRLALKKVPFYGKQPPAIGEKPS
jgi:DUF1365 family protein